MKSSILVSIPLASMGMGCYRALGEVVDILSEFDSRLPVSFNETRAGVSEAVDEIDEWRDVCMMSAPSSPERIGCISKQLNIYTVKVPFGYWYTDGK